LLIFELRSSKKEQPLQESQIIVVPRHPDKRIRSLDGLRAISILLVLIGHGFTTLPHSSQLERFAPYFGNAQLGVLTFFVISGYLITHLLCGEWEALGKIQLRSFYFRRVLRIFPAFYTYLLVVVMLRVWGWLSTPYPDIAIASIFLTNYKHCFSILTNDDYWFVGHFWTLSLEEQFYLLWPATILVLGLSRVHRVALSIILAAPIIRVISYFIWPEARAQLGMMLHTAADPIMIGCLAALYQGHPKFEATLKRLSSWLWPLLAGLFLLVGSPWLRVQFQGAYEMTVGLSLSGIAVAFILLWVLRQPSTQFSRLLSTPLLVHIGVLSYSLYLWQQLFLTPRNTGIFGMFPLNFVACFVVAELSYWIVESPFLRLRNRFRRDRG
jgi:peptidoglycan/LPS O-acetylase OafA/YrhL